MGYRLYVTIKFNGRILSPIAWCFIWSYHNTLYDCGMTGKVLWYDHIKHQAIGERILPLNLIVTYSL
jgi:hypothetical protein